MQQAIQRNSLITTYFTVKRKTNFHLNKAFPNSSVWACENITVPQGISKYTLIVFQIDFKMSSDLPGQ